MRPFGLRVKQPPKVKLLEVVSVSGTTLALLQLIRVNILHNALVQTNYIDVIVIVLIQFFFQSPAHIWPNKGHQNEIDKVLSVIEKQALQLNICLYIFF